MASLDLATIRVAIVADGREAIDNFRNVGQASREQAQQLKQDWAQVGQSLSSLGSKLVKSISLPIAGAMTACVKLASDLTETVSKTEVVFGDLSDTIFDWSESSVENMGMAQETALNMASTFGDLGSSMGLTSEQTAQMSMNLTQLAADMASFKNISIDRANTALQAVYTGETESLKAMGIVMTEANLQAFAMNEGIETSIKDMSQAEKVLLRYKYVMKSTANAQGDFVRTGDSLANQSRKLKENIKQLGAAFGKILEGSITGAVTALNSLVSWLNNLDEGTKAAIITVGEILALFPIVVGGVGAIITVVSKLHGALTSILAHPVVAGIAAATAAITALAVVIGNVSKSVEEYNRKVADMKDKQTTVSTTYKNLIETTEDEDKNIKEVLANISSAIQGAEDYIVSVQAVEDDDRNVHQVLLAIDSALKARELFCEISGKKKEDDAVWAELTAIRNGLYNGTMTIKGEDGNGTLASLESLIHAINADCQALEYYETNAIEPIVKVNTQSAQENVQQLYSKCAELAGLDLGGDIKYTFSVENLGSTEGGDGVLGALASAIASTEGWKGKLEEIGKSFESLMEQQKEYLLTISASQVISAFAAYDQGLITQQQLEATVRATNKQYLSLAQSLDQSGEAYNTLVATLNNGNPEDDMEAWANFYHTTQGLTSTMTETATNTEIAANATGRIKEQLDAGATSTQAMSGDVAILNGGLVGMAGDMEGQLNTAYSNYQTAIDNANTAEAEGVAQVDLAIAKKKEEQAALATFSTLLTEHTGNQSAALEALKNISEEQYQAVIDFYGGVPEQMGVLNSEIYDTAYTMQFDILAMEQDAEAQKKVVHDNANAARLTAEQEFGASIGSIQSGYDMQTLEQTKILCKQVGNEEGVAHIERIQALQGFCIKQQGKVEANNFTLLSLQEDYIADVASLGTSAYSSGYEVGSQNGQGMFDGLNSWAGKIKSKASQMVRDAINAAKRAQDSHSPSKKTRDLIGKPFVQGIEVGMEEQFPNVLRTVKRNMNNIISGGTGSIKLPSVSPTNIGRQGDTTINQTNNFTSRTLSPYEQQQEIRKLNKDLKGVFA